MAYLFTVYALGCAITLVAGVVEQRRHHRHLRRIRRRIVVNGIRGKSSITRLCAGALRGGGLITVAKTTGTAARFITPDGLEEPVYRKFGLANIVEQIGIVRRAAAYRPDALVIECMAVLPDLQEINERKLIQSTICVICNVREDHLTEMGPTLDDVARSLSRSMPIGGICVTAERDRAHILRAEAARRRTTLIQVDPQSVSDDEIRRYPYIAFKDNVAIALAVADLTGVDRDTALAGMIAARPDPGTVAVRTYQAEQRRISFANHLRRQRPGLLLDEHQFARRPRPHRRPRQRGDQLQAGPDRAKRSDGRPHRSDEPGANRAHRRADPQRQGCRARRTR
jgi:poly-gamma-glutamate synthase PgsB/CapB